MVRKELELATFYKLMKKRESLNHTWTLISTFDTALLSDFSKFESHTRDRLRGSNKPRNAVEKRLKLKKGFLVRLFEAFQFNSI